MMKDPVDHILRPSLPWRDQEGAMTECGLNAAKVPAITREAYATRLKDLGRNRAAMLTCMTCSHTSERWADWRVDPRDALAREIEWETHGRRGLYKSTGRDVRLRDELVVIADMIAENRVDFDRRLSELRARRDWLQKKIAMAAKPSSSGGQIQ